MPGCTYTDDRDPAYVSVTRRHGAGAKGVGAPDQVLSLCGSCCGVCGGRCGDGDGDGDGELSWWGRGLGMVRQALGHGTS